MVRKVTELFQTADWKKEKHVPVIDAPDVVKKGELVKVSLCVGKEIPHPNKTDHHIAWIKLAFWPEEGKFPYEIGMTEFDAHGASAQGPDTSTIYTEPQAVFAFKTEKAGKLISTSYCNVHGFWKDEKKIRVE